MNARLPAVTIETTAPTHLPVAPMPTSPLVLMIDDDGMMRKLVRRALEADGFRVEEAEDGEAGVAMLALMLSPQCVVRAARSAQSA